MAIKVEKIFYLNSNAGLYDGSGLRKDHSLSSGGRFSCDSPCNLLDSEARPSSVDNPKTDEPGETPLFFPQAFHSEMKFSFLTLSSDNGRSCSCPVSRRTPSSSLLSLSSTLPLPGAKYLCFLNALIAIVCQPRIFGNLSIFARKASTSLLLSPFIKLFALASKNGHTTSKIGFD